MKSPNTISANLPDPVVGSAGAATVEVWVDKDHWVGGAPPPDAGPERYFVSAVIQRGVESEPLEVDLLGMSSGEIEDLAAALQLVAMMTKGR